MDLQAIVHELAKRRPIFHSEADFQHALAWGIHGAYPSADVRLEINVRGLGRREHIDILVRNGVASAAIELKYKTKQLDLVHGGEDFRLLNHGAQDIGRYDFIKDLVRLERFAQSYPNAIGYALLLTNDENYWKESKRASTADAMFRLHEGGILSGRRAWGEGTGAGTMKGRENPLVLGSAYTVRWFDYSRLSNGTTRFRYVLLEVKRGGVVAQSHESESPQPATP